MNSYKAKKQRDTRRKFHIKNTIKKSGKLRLCISKSNKNMFAQIIDDAEGKTLVSACTQEKDFPIKKNCANIDAAIALGKVVSERAKEKSITEVVFDRNGYLYHGKIKAFADSARENGLIF